MNVLVSLSHIVDIFKDGGVRGLWQRLRYRFTSPNYAQWGLPNVDRGADVILVDTPLISIILPVYGGISDWLMSAVKSVINQRYQHWQLCIVGDGAVLGHLHSILDDVLMEDDRIDVVVAEENNSVAALVNCGLQAVKGQYFALLDGNDELAVIALDEVVRCLNIYPETDFIYTDEDQITFQGKRKNPFFKPDWSPEYFQAYPYACHLGVSRTGLVRQIGGVRCEYDGAHEWDLVLRLTERTGRICHIPKVLYHRRALRSSTGTGAQKALQAAVDRSAYPGTVVPYGSRFFKVRRHIQGNPLVSIVIPSAGTCVNLKGRQVCLLEQCVDSVRRCSTYQNFEIILVDGYDIPETYLSALQGPDLRLVRCDQPFNFAQRVNWGVQAARGDVLLLLNDDTEVITPDWIEAMLELAQQPEIGAVGAKLFYPNGRLQHAGMLLLGGMPSHAFHNGAGKSEGYFGSNVVNRNYLGVTAACLMMRRRVFEELDGFDESFPLSYNDVDLCLRAHQASYRNVFTPHAELLHYESVSRVSKLRPGELERLHGRFADTGYLVDDPYYNPNLSIRRPFFQLAWPDERKQDKG